MSFTNFEGISSYEPKSNPLKGLTKEEINDFCFAYMKMWYDNEGFCDFNAMYDAGEQGMCADWLVGAGAIDSDSCFPHCKGVESTIEAWAASYRKKSPKARSEALDAVFTGFTVVSCSDCNSVQFYDESNAKAYAQDILEGCSECSSKKLKTRKWEDMSK